MSACDVSKPPKPIALPLFTVFHTSVSLEFSSRSTRIAAMTANVPAPPARRRRGLVLLFVLVGVGIGFFAGVQVSVLQVASSELAEHNPINDFVPASGVPEQVIDNSGPLFTLHERVKVKEDQLLFDSEFRPKIDNLLKEYGGGTSILNGCKEAEIEPYLNILRNVQSNPKYYERNVDDNYDWKCPLVLLFYYESGTKSLFDRWVQYYSRITQRRCIKIIAPKRYRNVTDIHTLTGLGYELIGPGWPIKQDKVININLDAMQKDEDNYGEDTLVSVNDLDHLMVFFGTDGKPHRYSSYSDMVALYVYELLSVPKLGNRLSCGGQMMAERYNIPCTCVLEDNSRYISLDENSLIYSEYGKANKFHSTANFYLRNGKPLGTNQDEWLTGTVYANLRGFQQDAITHHKIAYKTKSNDRREAAHLGVLHFRSDSYLTTTTKYMHFLKSNGLFSNDKAAVEDVMVCATANTEQLFKENKRCRAVKEIANIISQVHQKQLCLDAGYSEAHCANELTCCLTEPGWSR